jgi:hypothetical protein
LSLPGIVVVCIVPADVESQVKSQGKTQVDTHGLLGIGEAELKNCGSVDCYVLMSPISGAGEMAREEEEEEEEIEKAASLFTMVDENTSGLETCKNRNCYKIVVDFAAFDREDELLVGNAMFKKLAGPNGNGVTLYEVKLSCANLERQLETSSWH